MSEKLLPCPFCHNGTLALWADDHGDVYCGACGAEAPPAAWNRRHVPELSAEDRKILCDAFLCGDSALDGLVLNHLRDRGLAIVRVKP